MDWIVGRHLSLEKKRWTFFQKWFDIFSFWVRERERERESKQVRIIGRLYIYIYIWCKCVMGTFVVSSDSY